jgi:hypothetical protein
MEPTPELIDELYREEILRARAMPPEEKLFAGARLFDYACAITLAGIRHQHPGIDDEGALELLRQRLALARRLEEGNDE